MRPVLYNSWEATHFDVNEPGQRALAEQAAKLGVELFVVDDGWFGKRNNDRAGLGDWFVNPQKFPRGINGLIDFVNKLGMDFGLWVEPEMVNPDSDLYRAHPDWVMNFPNRPRSELRNQLVLNLARKDVKEYIFGVLDKLAGEYKIRYFKWDMNRAFSEPGWPELAPPISESFGSGTCAICTRSWTDCVRNIPSWRLNPAPVEAAESISASCSAQTKCGPQITQKPSIAFVFRKVSRRCTPRR